MLSENGASAPSRSVSLGDYLWGHLATHSPPINDKAQGCRDREAITEVLIRLATCLEISMTIFITTAQKPVSFLLTKERFCPGVCYENINEC